MDDLDDVAARLNEAALSVPKRSGEVIQRAARDIQTQARQRVPTRSGARLRESIEVEDVDDLTSAVGPTAFYGHIVEGGARPHEITGAPLAWPEGVFTSRVSHPGVKPHPYLEPALEAVLPGLIQELGRLVQEVL